MVEGSAKPETTWLGEAIDATDRTEIGDGPPTEGFPFRKELSNNDAEVLLRQVSPKEFVLEESFRYVAPPHPEVLVALGDKTDLASVPGFLTWLVPRYGRHTLPALLHDQLCVSGMDPNVREQADATLRDAMQATGVPFARRWLMWGAVSLATNALRGWRWKVFLVAWLLLYGLAGLYVYSLALRWHPPLSGLAVGLIFASPIVLSLVWGRRYRCGVIAAYAFLLLPASVVAVMVTVLAYLAAEAVARVYLSATSQPANPVRTSKLEV